MEILVRGPKWQAEAKWTHSHGHAVELVLAKEALHLRLASAVQGNDDGTLASLGRQVAWWYNWGRGGG